MVCVPAVPAGLTLRRVLGSIDVRLIDPGDIAICKRDDGSDWLLGAGSFGKVMRCAVSCRAWPAYVQCCRQQAVQIGHALLLNHRYHRFFCRSM
jgi:hypothetical protein